MGRDPRAIERMNVRQMPASFNQVDSFLEAGPQQVILGGAQPFDMKTLEVLVKLSGR